MLNEFPELVLRAIRQENTRAYGVSIRRYIENEKGEIISVGTLYTTLARLEEQGLVSSVMGEATPERGGRPKRFYTILDAGRKALDDVEYARRSAGQKTGKQVLV